MNTKEIAAKLNWAMQAVPLVKEQIVIKKQMFLLLNCIMEL